MVITRIRPRYNEAGQIQGYIDRYTGEEYGFPVIVGRKKNPYEKGWVMNSQEALEIVAKDRDIKGETYRVLFFICARLDFENWVQISITDIANELGLKQPHVSRAFKVLEEKEIILRGPKVGRSFAFRLNPEFGWKGKVKHLDDYRQSDQDLTNAYRERQQKKIKETLTVVEPTKEQEIIRAIREGEVDIDKFYQLLCQEKARK